MAYAKKLHLRAVATSLARGGRVTQSERGHAASNCVRSSSEDPRPSTVACRGAALGLTLSLLVVALASATLGCALGRPRPTPTATAKPDVEVAKSEPYLLLRLGERRLYLMDDEAGHHVESFPVAIGRERFPTPIGRFRVNEMQVNPDFLVFDFNDPSARERGRIPPGPNSPLGLRWIGFANAYGWSIGFHGTSKTELLGQAVSHGCVRMRNEDVVRVYDRVKIGTPVIVEP